MAPTKLGLYVAGVKVTSPGLSIAKPVHAQEPSNRAVQTLGPYGPTEKGPLMG